MMHLPKLWSILEGYIQVHHLFQNTVVMVKGIPDFLTNTEKILKSNYNMDRYEEYFCYH